MFYNLFIYNEVWFILFIQNYVLFFFDYSTPTKHFLQVYANDCSLHVFEKTLF